MRTDISNRYKCKRIQRAFSKPVTTGEKLKIEEKKTPFLLIFTFVCITSPCLQHIKLISSVYWHNSCGPGHMLGHIKSLINRNYYFLTVTRAYKGKSSWFFSLLEHHDKFHICKMIFVLPWSCWNIYITNSFYVLFS